MLELFLLSVPITPPVAAILLRIDIPLDVVQKDWGRFRSKQEEIVQGIPDVLFSVHDQLGWMCLWDSGISLSKVAAH